MHTLIGVVICTYNRAEMLRRALETVIRQETGGRFACEVVLIDNGSTDGTQTVIEEAARSSPVPVRYVREDGELGDRPCQEQGDRRIPRRVDRLFR